MYYKSPLQTTMIMPFVRHEQDGGSSNLVHLCLSTNSWLKDHLSLHDNLNPLSKQILNLIKLYINGRALFLKSPKTGRSC